MDNPFALIRAKLGWTQQQCADYIGIHRVRWAQLEADARPSVDTAYAVIELGMQCNQYLTLDDFFPRNGE